MIDCDDTNWPLAIAVAEKAISPADHRLFLDRWKCWLDRGRPFVLLRMFVSDEAVIQPESLSGESASWLAANIDRVRSLVLAIATTVPRHHLEARRLLDVDSVSGIPSKVFADGVSAVAWLDQDILRPHGLTLDGL
jgi:hypothetical protein